MKEKILELRKSGKSYREIEKILSCSRSTIAYHCSEGYKKKNVHRCNVRCRKYKQILVDLLGGKCEKCGYNKCLSALEFHHLDPNEKDFSVSDFKNSHLEKMKVEVEKCILVCSNCHRELHESLK